MAVAVVVGASSGLVLVATLNTVVVVSSLVLVQAMGSSLGTSSIKGVRVSVLDLGGSGALMLGRAFELPLLGGRLLLITVAAGCGRQAPL